MSTCLRLKYFILSIGVLVLGLLEQGHSFNCSLGCGIDAATSLTIEPIVFKR